MSSTLNSVDSGQLHAEEFHILIPKAGFDTHYILLLFPFSGSLGVFGQREEHLKT